MKKLTKLLVLLALIPATTACANNTQAATKDKNVRTEIVKDYSYQSKTKKLGFEK
jgi:hypothetical protein